MKAVKLALVMTLFILAMPLSGKIEIPPPPPETASDYGFGELDEATMKKLLEQGSLIIVRQKEDLSLINVTAGQVVNAPIDLVWAAITDFEHYPEFMPQTSEEKILERQDDDIVVVEQSLAIKIWRLPSVDLTYQLAQKLSPPDRLRFWHLEGPLAGTYGGWDLVPAGDQTMIFYTIYSNLTALGWGLGSIFKAEPDFMGGVNTTTAIMVVKAVKKECERRAGN